MLGPSFTLIVSKSVPGTGKIGTRYRLKLYCILIAKYVTIYTLNGLVR